jgi:transketolase
MQVFCPADEAELLAGIPKLLDAKQPTYVRYYAGKPVVDHQPFEIGKAEQLGSGRDVTLLVYGFLLREVVHAKAILEQRGLSVRVLNVRTPKPIDRAAILRAARETKMLVTIEDHFRTGGLYSIVAELLLEERTSAHVLPIALEEKWFVPALLPEVLAHERFTGPQIADRVLASIQ